MLVPQTLAKQLLETIKKGDFESMKAEAERLGNGQPQLVLPYLVDEKYNHNAVFYAALIKDESIQLKSVEYLLNNGVDANKVDNLNQTALYYASREGKPGLIDILIKHGCDVNHLDSNEQSPLFYASREGHIDVVKRLVQVYGAHADQEDKNGQTPLYYAVRANRYETVEFLIKQGGANVNHEDKKQQTPMNIARNNNKQAIMNLLVAYGAKGLDDLRKQNKLKEKRQI